MSSTKPLPQISWPFLFFALLAVIQWSKLPHLKELAYSMPYSTLELSAAVYDRTFYSLADSFLLAAPMGTAWMVWRRGSNMWGQWWIGALIGLVFVEMVTKFLSLPAGEAFFALNYSMEDTEGISKIAQRWIAIVSNSANAAVLTVYFALFLICTFKSLRQKLWRFPVIHFGAILAVAIIYHVSLIGGIMKPEMSRVIHLHHTLLRDEKVLANLSNKNLFELFQTRRYEIYAGELQKDNLPTLIGQGALKRLESSVEAAQYVPNREIEVISRETKLHLGEVAFVGVAKVDENGSGFLLIDVDHFAAWFTSMDKILSIMLTTASLIWVGFIFFLMRMHGHVFLRAAKN